MGLLAQAKEQQKEKLSKQFISFYDSVLYLGEPEKEACNFILSCLDTNILYLALAPLGLELVALTKKNQERNTRCVGYSIGMVIGDLTGYFLLGKKDGDISVIQNLGFSKKIFIEILLNHKIPVDEKEIIEAQSPDLVFYGDNFEVDYYTYEMIVKERDELRERVANQTPTDQNAQIERLNQQLEKAKAENAELQSRLNRLEAGTPAEPIGDKELNTKSQNTVAKILNAVLELADLNTNDPYSYDNPTSTNYFIYNQLVKNKMIVKPQTIGKWIELASQQTTDE